MEDEGDRRRRPWCGSLFKERMEESARSSGKGGIYRETFGLKATGGDSCGIGHHNSDY